MAIVAYRINFVERKRDEKFSSTQGRHHLYSGSL